jgi:hypothetical protein
LHTDPEGYMRDWPSQSRRILAPLFVGVLITGVVACTPRLLPDYSRSEVLREAETLYDYGPERPPLSGVDPNFPGPHVPDGTIPRMWISTATLKPNVPLPRTRIIARIRSTAPYPQMGITAGYNYIWRSSRDSSVARKWTTAVVSADAGVRSHRLERDGRLIEYTHGDPAEPRLVVLRVASVSLGACLDDPVCLPAGHCGYY